MCSFCHVVLVYYALHATQQLMFVLPDNTYIFRWRRWRWLATPFYYLRVGPVYFRDKFVPLDSKIAIHIKAAHDARNILLDSICSLHMGQQFVE